MNFERCNDGDEKCPNKECSAIYTVQYMDYPVRDRGSFTCELCGQLIRSWKGTRDWFFTLKRPEAEAG